MKKFLFMGAIAAMLLGTASCSNEVDQPAMGDEVNAAFRVNLDGIESRTISDGLTVNELYFEVYEAKTQGEGESATTTYTKLPSLSQKVDVANKTATVTTKLIKGKTYKFAFWAQKEGAYNAANLQNIQMNYANANANDENRDAFFANVEKKVEEAFEQDVTLYRPFAQINFGASDVDAAMDISGFTSQLVVKNVPNQFNVLNGEATGDEAEVTLTATAVPAVWTPKETLTVDGKDYTYISMNYILATPEKATKDITLKVMDGETEVKELPVSSCPMQRNYRTNILGDILSVEGKFNITVDPIYTGDHNVDPDATVFNVTTKEEFDAALVSDAKKIVINLPEGEIKYTAGYFYPNNEKCYGGPNTESITIIGKGIDITTINGENTYRSWFNTKNPDCVVTLKNLTATSSGNSANTWDGYDCAFSGPLNVENVKFLKPVALSNEGKKTYFKNVYIDATNTPSEAYALWVCAGTDVTLEDCTFNGVNADPSNGRLNRGIKISDQYSYNGGAIPTMTYFDAKNIKVMSDKKAAILVGTVAGATIAIDGIDLTEVAADHVNAVHIDNAKNEKGLKYTDYMNLVTVTGGNCIVEP